MAKKIPLALIQLRSSQTIEQNVARTINHVKTAADNGAQIILLQELFTTPYFCQTVNDAFFDWAQTIPGPLTVRLSELAEELQVVIVAPFFERRAAGVYHNSLVVIDADGSLIGTYRKKHIPEDPGFHEKYYFTPGDDEYAVFETRYASIGAMICWDQWFPEAARIMALKGADLLVYPTAIGTLPDEDEQTEKKFHDAWQTIQRSHAIANGCYVASVNRVGQENDILFWGQSFVSGPFGQMLGEAGKEEEILHVEIDLAEIEKQRQIWPFFRDRRNDTYGPLLKRLDD